MYFEIKYISNFAETSECGFEKHVRTQHSSKCFARINPSALQNNLRRQILAS